MKYPHLESIVLIVIFILLMVFGSSKVFASGSHHEYVVNNTTKVEKSSNSAMALSAAQLNFDWSTQALQLSGGVGSHNGAQALSIGLGKRVGQVLFNASATSGGGYAAGATLRIK